MSVELEDALVPKPSTLTYPNKKAPALPGPFLFANALSL